MGVKLLSLTTSQANALDSGPDISLQTTGGSPIVTIP